MPLVDVRRYAEGRHHPRNQLGIRPPVKSGPGHQDRKIDVALVLLQCLRTTEKGTRERAYVVHRSATAASPDEGDVQSSKSVSVDLFPRVLRTASQNRLCVKSAWLTWFLPIMTLERLRYMNSKVCRASVFRKSLPPVMSGKPDALLGWTCSPLFEREIEVRVQRPGHIRFRLESISSAMHAVSSFLQGRTGGVGASPSVERQRRLTRRARCCRAMP